MQDPTFPFKEMALLYPVDALQPQLPASLLQAHYDEFYKRDLLYLNSTIASTPKLQNWSLREIILYQIRYEPVTIQNAAKYYAGSVYNHTLYFQGMAPAGSTTPGGQLLNAINERYGSMGQLRSLILDAVSTMLGVGWVWLNSEQDGNIHIAVTKGNETPQLSAVTPIFTVDCWEHAYLGQYSSRVVQYVNSWFDLINWDVAAQRYDASLLQPPRQKMLDFPMPPEEYQQIPVT